MESVNQAEPDEIPFENLKPVICGFWRRLLAFFIDVLILGLFGASTGFFFYDLLAELGGWGRLIGFGISLLYFGLLNCSIGNGQTIGKRILKIRVVDHREKTISIPKSFLRFTILGIPYFLNGALLPSQITSNFFMMLILGLLVFFGGGAIAYLFIFNRGTRQSLHDLAVGTYVVNMGGPRKEFSIEPIWKGHLAVVGVLFFTTIILIGFVIPKLANKAPFPTLLAVQKQIQNSGIAYTATVTVGRSSGTNITGEGRKKWKTTYLSATAVMKHRPSDYNAVATQIASIVLETYPEVIKKDALVINVSYGYDIGIASAWRNQSTRHTPNEWNTLLGRQIAEKTI